MSGLFSFFSSKPAKENLEAVLAELDENIRCTQISVNEIRLQRDKNSSTTLLYLILGYFLYIGIYTLLLRDPELDTWGESFSKFAPIVVIPIAIYYIWTLGNYYYEKQLDAEKTKLRTLTEKKVLKIEEIKNSSSYNKTRTILERYGDERKGERSIERQSSRSLVPANPVASSQKLRSTSQSTRLIENQRPAPRNNQSQNLKQYSSTPSLKKAAPRPQTLRSTPSSGWLDRIVDAIVGEETTENKVVVASQGARQFALVCMHCFSHNGLVTDIEYDSMSYNCPKCSRFNPSRRSLRRQNQQNRDPRGQPQMLRASTGALTNAKPRSDELKSSYSSGRVRIKEPAPISDEEADAVASDDSGFVEKKPKSKASTSQQAYPTEAK